MVPGAHVRILPPFAEFFPGMFEVESLESLEGGDSVHLVGVEPTFSPQYLEVVNE